MKWRVVLELVGADGTAAVHEVSGGAAVVEYTPRLIGLTLAEGKHMLAAVQRHLVEAQTEDHCRRGPSLPVRLPVRPLFAPLLHGLWQKVQSFVERRQGSQ
jgi:hypothetical protein